MKLKVFAVTLLAAVLLGACSGNSTGEEGSAKENEPSDIKGLVSDYSTGAIKSQNASITSQQLIITDKDGSKLAYDLPKKEFFVSIAPYANETHP